MFVLLIDGKYPADGGGKLFDGENDSPKDSVTMRSSVRMSVDF